jgi:hypothetical protein
MIDLSCRAGKRALWTAVAVTGLFDWSSPNSLQGQSPMPELSIGRRITTTSERDIELFRVRTAALWPDGSFAVGNGGDRNVVLVSGAGEELLRFGRRGSGPGDFQGIDGLFVRGDSIHVYDAGLMRLSTFDRSGRLLSSSRLPLVGGRPTTLRAFRSTTEYFVTSTASHIGSPSGLYRDRVQVLRVAGAGSPLIVTTEDWTYSYHFVQEGATSTYATPFLGRAHLFHVANRLVLVPLTGGAVTLVASDGSRDAIPLPASLTFARTDVDRYRDSLLRVAGPGSASQRIQVVFGPAFPAPSERTPVESGAVVGEQVWLRAIASGSPGRAEYWIVDVPSARLAAKLQLPFGSRVLGGDDRHVLVVETDSLGVESVSVYEQPRRSGRPSSLTSLTRLPARRGLHDR